MRDDRVSLAEILERIERALEFAGARKEDFLREQIRQDAVLRQLEVIGEASKRVGEATRSLDEGIPWKGMAGFKDVAIHRYEAVDLARVWSIVHDTLPRIRTRVRKVLTRMPKLPSEKE